MAAPSLFAQPGFIDGSTGTIVAAWQQGYLAGDMGLLVVETSGNGSDISISGWTHVPGSPVVDIADATGSKLQVLYKFAQYDWASGAPTNEPDVTVPDTGDHQVGGIYVFRGVDTSLPFADTEAGSKTTASTTATLPAVTTAYNDCMILLVCGRPNDEGATNRFSTAVNANLTGITALIEGGTTSGNGGGFSVQYGILATAGNSGTSEITKLDSTTDTYLTIALAPVGSAPPDADGYISVPGPLSAPSVFGELSPQGYASVPSMLAAPFTLADVTIASLVSVPSPLIGAQVVTFSDFSTAPELLRSTEYYVCDIVDGADTHRVKISSWQATLQLDASNYLQAVIPACDQYMDMLTGLSADAQFIISKGARLSNGTNVENELARAPVSLRFDQGPMRHTCTMSGYSDAFTLPTSPSAVTDRTLRDVRSSSTDTGGRRFRCAIDWFLRPGQTAIYDEQTMLVSYMNYYVTMDGQGDAYMDVGERI